MAQNPNIDDDTRARARKFVDEGTAPAAKKQRMVSKKELDASGLSLRDFLNRERGLTRRKEPEQKPQQSVGGDMEAGVVKPRRAPEGLSSVMRPGTNVNYENPETSDMMKRGGKVKKMASGGSASSRADGCAVKGKTKGRIL